MSKQQILQPGHLTRREWAKRLNDQWDRICDTAVNGFVHLGDDLLAAKADLGPRGLWEKFLENDLKFVPATARVFMRIATWMTQNASIARGSFRQLLPPDYTTIDKLIRLDANSLKRFIKQGVVCPTLKRNEIAKILRIERVTADERRVLRLRPNPGKYRTIVIDPAWEYDWLSLAGRAKPGYAMQTRAQLMALELADWAEPDCELYCWTTNNFMFEACKLVERWGWQHRTVLTWIKPPPFGLGSYFRNSTEHVLYATRGEATTRPAAASIPTHFEAPRGKHSEKPEEFYDIVRKASYPPYGEGNQIAPRKDFTNLFIDIKHLEAAE